MTSVRVVLGLGNPGREYARTRHNLGALVLEQACERLDLKLIPSLRSRSLLAEYRNGTDVVAYAFPQTYMNNSGLALQGLLRRYKLKSPADLIVIHDELDLPPGAVRLKLGGGVAGHNGLKSIVAALGTADFARIRIGIGRPIGAQSVVDYVLAQLTLNDMKGFADTLAIAADALELALSKGVEPAMNDVNRE